MKTTLRLSSLLLLVMAAGLALAFKAGPAMHFEETKHNFGFIRQGDIVSHEFVFTNTGDEPLIITDAEVACVCTTVDFPKRPILKGEKATVKVTFDSKSAIDRQERTVKLSTNTGIAPVLTFKAVVLKKKS